MRALGLFLGCLCSWWSAVAAPGESAWKQEKVYVQTDKPYYFRGDTIWMKGYLVDAESHRESEALSRFLYVELINENQRVVLRKKLREEEGCFRNFFALQEDVPEGRYMLRAYTQWMRNAGEDYFFTRQLSVMQRSQSLLSVQTRLERTEGKRYLVATLLRQNGKPYAGKQVRYMVRTQEQGNRHLWRRTNQKGEVRIRVPERLQVSQYVELTLKDGNLNLTQRIDLPSVEDYHVGFYPEGGHLLCGVPQVVAFKAEAEGGRAPRIRGWVLTQSGDTLTTLASEHEGIGAMVLKAPAGDSLVAVVTDETGLEKRFALPQPRADRVALQVKQDEQRVNYRLLVPEGVALQERLQVMAHVRGRIVAQQWLERGVLEGSFDKQGVPEGIVHLTVFNEGQVAVSERLVFVRSEQPLYQVAVAGKAKNRRSLMKVGVRLLDENLEPLMGDFALSITDQGMVKWNEADGHIRSSLLLTSDLKGRVPTPGYYLQEATPVVERHTDQLMLTHGWTRYPSGVLLEPGREPQWTWQPEQEQMIRGRVRNVMNRPLKRGLDLSVALTDYGKLEVVKTEKDGSFCLIHNCPDLTHFVITPSKKRAESFTVALEEVTFPEVGTLPWNLWMGASHEDTKPEVRPLDFVYAGGEKVYEVPEVTIQGKADTGEYEYESFSTSMIEQIPAENVLQLLNQMPEVCVYRVRQWLERDKVWVPTGERYIGLNKHEAFIESYLAKGEQFTSTVAAAKGPTVRVQQDLEFQGNKQVTEKVRGAAPFKESCVKVAVFVDSVKVEDQRNLEKLKASEVLYIDFLNNRKFDGNKYAQNTPEWENSEEWMEQTSDKLMEEYRQGIVITTRRLMRGRFTESLPHVAHVVPLGYAEQAEFYAPVYATEADRKREWRDDRTTIYWAPQLKLNEQGEAVVSFYTGDRTSSYTMTLEGVTSDGRVCRYVKVLP